MDVEKNIARSSELIRQASRAKIAFLKAELEISLTFAQSALAAGSDAEKRRRNRANALKGYHTFVSISGSSPSSEFTENDMQEILEKLSRLISALERLGIAFE